MSELDGPFLKIFKKIFVHIGNLLLALNEDLLEKEPKSSLRFTNVFGTFHVCIREYFPLRIYERFYRPQYGVPISMITSYEN